MTKLKIKNRLAQDRLMLWGVCLFAALTAVPLLAILGEVLLRGYDQLSWSFFTEPTPTAYKAMKAIEAGEPIPGGIANGIIGTMIMLGMAVVVAVPVGILCGAFLAENPQEPFCTGCKLPYRLAARYTIGHYRYHYLYLGGCAYERILGNSRQCGTLYHDASAYYPFYRGDPENPSCITQGGRACSWW